MIKADRIARALLTPGGHLATGRGGYTLHAEVDGAGDATKSPPAITKTRVSARNRGRPARTLST